jgi:SAM-dependent methyltransferase
MSIGEENLEKIAERFSSKDGYNAHMSDFAYRTIEPFFQGHTCLELGCSDGQMTSRLLAYFNDVVAVDGSSVQIDRLEKYFSSFVGSSGLQTRVCLVEDLRSHLPDDRKFETVVASYLLEHVDDPVAALLVAKGFLSSDGVVIAVVPNANSIHRIVGQYMGLLESRTDLSDQDLHDGHRRTYTIESLVADFHRAGLVVTRTGGVLLKPLPASQMGGLSAEVEEGLYKAGQEFPGFCSSIFAVGR